MSRERSDIMKKIFSAKLYVQGLRKIRIPGVAMAAVIIALNSIYPIHQALEYRGHSYPLKEIETVLFAPFGILVMLFAPLLVYAMFSYLNERRASDFFHALPQTRICVYVSFMSSVLTWIVSVLAASTLVNLILWSFSSRQRVDAQTVLMTFLGFLILGMAMAGFMALAMTVTGTTVANWLVFLLFCLFIRLCGIFFLNGFSTLTPMFVPEKSWLGLLDWDSFLPNVLLTNMFWSRPALDGMGRIFLYWFFVAVLLLVLSAVAYSRRRSENAGKSAPNRLTQHIYRIAVTLPFFGYGAYMLIVMYGSMRHKYPPYLKTALIYVGAGLILWIVFELLTTKKPQNILRTLPALLIAAALSFAGVGSLYAARGIFYASLPEREDIRSLKPAVTAADMSGLEYMLWSTTEISDPAVLDRVYDALAQTEAYYKMTREERAQANQPYRDKVTLTLQSGREVTYWLQSSHDLDMLFVQSDECRTRRLSALDFDVKQIEDDHVKDEESVKRIWEALKADFDALDDEKKLIYLQQNAGFKNNGTLHIDGSLEGVDFRENFHLSEVYTPTAYRIYIECYMNEKFPPLEQLQAAADLICATEKADIGYLVMDIVSAQKAVVFHTDDPNVIKGFLQSLVIDSHLLDYEKAVKREIYSFALTFIRTDSKGDVVVNAPVNEKDGHAVLQMYLTFSDEDIARYREILASAETMPIS